MTTPGHFELYSEARPALLAGPYTATGAQDLVAQTPIDGDQSVPVDNATFHLVVDAPRYSMPPDQILSTFPPAGAQGDWRERMPQIVLKRRTLPWERNPDPAQSHETAPPWLALVVLAEGEGTLSTDVDPSQCVSLGVNLGPEADVPTAKYLEVTQDLVHQVFPCRDELSLLCHVRKVDLSDTELAMGDDDGYMAVVLSSRLPQPAPPPEGGGTAQPLKYTAYLINVEQQLPALLATEPDPLLFFDRLNVTALVDPELMTPAPNATIDQIAMQLGPGRTAARLAAGPAVVPAGGGTVPESRPAPYPVAGGIEGAAGAWRTGPAAARVSKSTDLAVAGALKDGISSGFPPVLTSKLRFPVLVSWDFVCTADGGFERLMNDLDVGLLGTVDQAQPPAGLEVAATGHVALPHRTRRGEQAVSWYRGPLGPQPTVRAEAVDGVLAFAHTGDQLRRIVPDGREDISLAVLFEIGRLLTLNKPTLVAQLMQWRRDLFGAARARELAGQLAGSVLPAVGDGAVGGRNALEGLVRSSVVGAFTAMPADAMARSAPAVTTPRVPVELDGLGPAETLSGLGLDPGAVGRYGKQFGVDGLGQVPVTAPPAPAGPAASDKVSMAGMTAALGQRVDDLMVSVLKTDGVPSQGVRPRRRRRKDTLDRLIEEAGERAAGRGTEG